MVRAGLPAKFMSTSSEAGCRLWQTRRFVHVACASGNGCQALHILSVWGFPNSKHGPRADVKE
eukprot:5445638-Karenia_brevis.AAC.1